MFTGIIEEVGRIAASRVDAYGGHFSIAAHDVIEDTQPGDSVAVNGACLTVTDVRSDHFTVDAIPETLRRTNLGDLVMGDWVNLERAVRPTSRLGGHFVQGHVDDTGTVVASVPDGDAIAVRIEAQSAVLHYVVEKGFIAVDGASLTVTEVDCTGFGVALIPYTREHTAPSLHTIGRRVNLEVDILAKYLEKLVIH